MFNISVPKSGEKVHRSRVTREIFRVLLSGEVAVAGAIMAVVYFAMQSLETFLPIYMGSLRVESWLIGAVFTIELFVIMVLKPYSGRLSDAVGRVKVIALGLATSAIGIIGMSCLKSYLGLVLSVIVFAVGASFTTASTPPLVSELVSEEKYGAALGAMETIKDVGQALGPIFIGLILSYIAFENALVIISVVLVLVLPLIYLKLKS